MGLANAQSFLDIPTFSGVDFTSLSLNAESLPIYLQYRNQRRKHSIFTEDQIYKQSKFTSAEMSHVLLATSQHDGKNTAVISQSDPEETDQTKDEWIF